MVYNKERLLVVDMVASLIQPKLYIPRSKMRLVSRPRLLHKLDDVRERKLALISAPAGFGKTTLLSEWIEQQGQHPFPLQVAWLSLDAHDNNPARFLTYLVAALQKLDASIGEEVLPALQAFQINAIQEIWEILASRIASGECSFVLVLDDYHAIEAPVIHEGIAYMLEQMPSCMHVVISTRADPQLPLSRLRVSRELVELRANDLRFSSDEIADFLAQWIEQKLSSADQAELEARTEGWIAGLQLAALAIQGLEERAAGDQDQITAFVQRLSGSTRFIMDYLVEEVLQQLPSDWRDFLLQTSILENLSGELCDAVTERGDSQSLLEDLEKTNLFLFPMDDERDWYRYHHLFADLLRSTLQYEQPAAMAELHRRASAWYKEHNLTNEAIQHAMKIPDPGAAAHLMEAVALETLRRGELTTLRSWSSWIAEEQTRQRPILCVCFAMAFLLSGRIELAEQYLSLVRPASATTDIQGHVITAHAMLAFYKGDYQDAIRYSNQAEEKFPQEPTALKGVLNLSAGAAYEMLGDDEAAFQAYQEAQQISHAFDNRITELRTLKKLGDLQVRRGQLHQAARSYQRTLQLGSIGEGKLLPVSAFCVCAMGGLLYEWDLQQEAERYLLQGIELSRHLDNPFALLANLQLLARLRWTQGDGENALRLRQETEQVLLECPPVPANAAQAVFHQVCLYLHMGEIQTAERWMQEHCQHWKSGHAYPSELMDNLLARLGIAQGEPLAALEAVSHSLPAAREAGRWGVVIELLILQALALALNHQDQPALAALEEALRLAEPQDYTRLFTDEGEPMTRLLRMVYRAREKGSREYETRLLEGLLSTEANQAQAPAKKAAGTPVDRPALIDPLTERELEVLQLIAEGHSNQEIAEKMVITLGTVKAHVSHIYSKLDVRSRTQAMVKASQLGLIQS